MAYLSVPPSRASASRSCALFRLTISAIGSAGFTAMQCVDHLETAGEITRWRGAGADGPVRSRRARAAGATGAPRSVAVAPPCAEARSA